MKVPRSVLDSIYSQIDSEREATVKTLAQMVRVPSVVGSEGEAQALMRRHYAALGLEMDVFEADEVEDLYSHPAYCGLELPMESRYKGRPNVVGTLPGNPDLPSLILNGHIDVVSPEPVEQWTHNPWGGVIEKGRMYGRGANDMKSGLIASWAALKAILATGYRPAGTLQLQSVIEEEAGGGGGALACFLRGHTADAFVAVEPTGFKVRIGSGGILYFRVKVHGRTAHAGNAHLGVNAVAKMEPITSALFDLDEKRGRENRHPLFEAGSMGRACHLSIGTYRAGDWPSTVAGWAVAEGRIGFLPGEERDDIKRLVEETVRQAAAGDEWLSENPPQVEWFGWKADPCLEDPDHPFIVHLKSVASEVLGFEVDHVARTSGVDSRFAHMFESVGVCFGPRGANNHGIDEYVEIESITECTKVLATLILTWCGWQEID